MKIAHPDFAFREAAEEACRNISTMVEKYVLFAIAICIFKMYRMISCDKMDPKKHVGNICEWQQIFSLPVTDIQEFNFITVSNKMFFYLSLILCS